MSRFRPTGPLRPTYLANEVQELKRGYSWRQIAGAFVLWVFAGIGFICTLAFAAIALGG